MRRREFITLIGGAVAWPITARAQQPVMPVIGFLRSEPLAEAAYLVTAFRQGLKETGYIDTENVAIMFRSADGVSDRLPALVAELISRPVAAIVTNNDATLAAKSATTTVPIVFATGGDPVREGFVASLNRPGGNVTGVVYLNSQLGAKRLALLRQFVPKAITIGMLVNQSASNTVAERSAVEAAAQATGQQLVTLDVNTDSDIEAAFTSFAQRGVGALLVGAGAFLNSHREQVVALAARHALPASYGWREAVVAGGLMSYAPSITDAWRRAGIYTGRILKGEKPADMPVQQLDRFEFVINLKTAKALSLEVPPTLLALADDVIE